MTLAVCQLKEIIWDFNFNSPRFQCSKFLILFYRVLKNKANKNIHIEKEQKMRLAVFWEDAAEVDGNRIKRIRECGQIKEFLSSIQKTMYRMYYMYPIPYVLYKVECPVGSHSQKESFFAKGF